MNAARGRDYSPEVEKSLSLTLSLVYQNVNKKKKTNKGIDYNGISETHQQKRWQLHSCRVHTQEEHSDRRHTYTKHDVIPSTPCITCDSLNWITICVSQVIEKRGRKVFVIFGNGTTELRWFFISFAILNSRALLERFQSLQINLSVVKHGYILPEQFHRQGHISNLPEWIAQMSCEPDCLNTCLAL